MSEVVELLGMASSLSDTVNMIMEIRNLSEKRMDEFISEIQKYCVKQNNIRIESII